MEIITIQKRNICIKGVGKMFYQEGFPISMSITELKKKDIEVSILHVADECMKNGWTPKTTLNKLKADFEDDIDNNKVDFELLGKFCNSTYEQQRKLIFDYLFRSNEEALNWYKNLII